MKSTSLMSLLFSTLTIFSLSTYSAGQSFDRFTYQAASVPVDVFVADLNHDGKLDVLTAQFESSGMNVFVNNGDGTFPSIGSGFFAMAGDDVNRVVAADFNGDGIPDAASQGCGSGGPAIRVVFGNGDGTFRETRDYDLPFPDPPFPGSCTDGLGFITLAHTTLPSLLVSTNDQTISILVNNGQGFFTQPQSIAVKMQSVQGAPGTHLTGASSGDYNGDGLQDIAAISTDPNSSNKHVVLFFQKPDGTFGPPVTIFTSNAGLQLTHTVDLNGDSKGDLLVSFFGGPTNRAGVIAFTNLGGGNFSSTVLTADPLYTVSGLKPASIHPVGKNPGTRGIILPLLPDPLIGGHPVFAFFPAQGTTWGAPVYFDDPGGTDPQAIANGDFNGDGRPDFAAVDKNDRLLVFMNTTTANTCGYPASGIHICSPAAGSTQTAKTINIHVSAASGPRAISSMNALIDGLQVINAVNTLDAAIPAKAGSHTMTVNATDTTGKSYQSSVKFTVQ